MAVEGAGVNTRRFPPFIKPLRDVIRKNRKTETRRVVKDCPFADEVVYDPAIGWRFLGGPNIKQSPYGQPGDTRFLIEPLHDNGDGFARYRDDDELVISNVTGERIKWRWQRWFLNSIHMPTEAARTFRTLTDVRVERVQDISEVNATAEGILYHDGMGVGHSGWRHSTDHGYVYDTAKVAFQSLWNSINAKRGYGWGANPWVWALTFKISEQGK